MHLMFVDGWLLIDSKQLWLWHPHCNSVNFQQGPLHLSSVFQSKFMQEVTSLFSTGLFQTLWFCDSLVILWQITSGFIVSKSPSNLLWCMCEHIPNIRFYSLLIFLILLCYLIGKNAYLWGSYFCVCTSAWDTTLKSFNPPLAQRNQ